MDAEDWVEPTYLEELYQALQAHKADIAVANYSVYKESEDRFYFYIKDERLLRAGVFTRSDY